MGSGMEHGKKCVKLNLLQSCKEADLGLPYRGMMKLLISVLRNVDYCIAMSNQFETLDNFSNIKSKQPLAQAL